jgi:two-component system, OmpR family, sensor kinase
MQPTPGRAPALAARGRSEWRRWARVVTAPVAHVHLPERLSAHWPLSLSIRWRLTIWYTVVLALTLAVFSLLVYWWLGQSLMHDIDTLSLERAMQVEERMVRAVREEQATRSGLLEAEQYLQLRASGVLVGDSFDPFRTPGVGVRIWNAHVKVIDASEELIGTPRLVDYQPIVSALQGKVHRYVLETREGSFYSYSYPTLFVSGRPMFVIQILTSLQSYERATERLKRLLLAGTVLVSLVAFATGAALSQTALQSINNITRTAQQINRARDLGRRIPVTGPRDEIRSLTETINEMLDRIEAIFDRQRQFMADVSHELRTPLTTIRGEVELIRRTGQIDPEGLAAVTDESERMSRLVGDLLLLARSDRELSLERAPVELDAVMLDVFRQAQRLAGDARVVSLAHVDACRVTGDRDRLKQLVLNLVQNALTHTAPGTHIELALRREVAAACITVADDGQGIPPEELDRVFERFYRVDKARCRNRGGTGLGLAIVDWIAGAHGGTVAVASTVGAGTTFTVRLPLEPDDDGA